MEQFFSRATLLICAVLAAILILTYRDRPWKVLPRESENHQITIVHYWGYPWNRLTLSLKQPGSGETEYLLQLNDGVSNGDVKTVSFPPLTSDEAVFQLELYEERSDRIVSGSFPASYQSGEQLQENGLLIYLTQYDEDSPYYVVMKSGKDTVCYSSKTGEYGSWTRASRPPHLRWLPHKDPWYLPGDDVVSNWEMRTIENPSA